jgi:hypothetical protein
MNMPAPAINMVYPMITKAAALALDVQYKALADLVVTAGVNEGNISANRNPAVVARRTKGEEIKTHTNQNMAIVEASLRQHQQNMVTLAARAKTVIATAQRLADNAVTSSDPTTLNDAARATALAGTELEHIAQAANDDSRAFFLSWNEYRELRLVNAPDEYKSEFMEARQRVMHAMKADTAKLEKLRQLVERGQAFHKLSAQLLNTGKKEKEVARGDAAKLEKDLKALFDKTISETSKIGLHSLVSKTKTLATKAKLPKVDKKEAGLMEGFHADVAATVKTYKTTVKTMTTIYTTALKGLTEKDRKDKAVATSLKNAKALLDEANAGLVQANVFLTQATKDIGVIRTKAK